MFGVGQRQQVIGRAFPQVWQIHNRDALESNVVADVIVVEMRWKQGNRQIRQRLRRRSNIPHPGARVEK